MKQLQNDGHFVLFRTWDERDIQLGVPNFVSAKKSFYNVFLFLFFLLLIQFQFIHWVRFFFFFQFSFVFENV